MEIWSKEELKKVGLGKTISIGQQPIDILPTNLLCVGVGGWCIILDWKKGSMVVVDNGNYNVCIMGASDDDGIV